MKHPSHRSAVILVALAAALALAPGALARDVRLSARVTEPFELNGKLYPASPIVVEHVRDYTPSSVLSEVWVGSEFVGLLRADRVEPQGGVESTSIACERDARGTLVLVGYSSVVPGERGEFRFHGARADGPHAPAAAAD